MNIDNNKTKDKNYHYMFSLTRHNKNFNLISDTGSSEHYIDNSNPHKVMVKMKNPGSVKLPDGKILKSTHVTNLDIPGLDQKDTKAYVVPKLKKYFFTFNRTTM